MEELLYLVLILVIGIFIIVPIIILAKVSSINRRADSLSAEVNELNNRILFLLNNGATKYDVNQILEKIQRGEGGAIPPIAPTPSQVEKPDEVIVPTAPIVEQPVREAVEEMPQVNVNEEVVTPAWTASDILQPTVPVMEYVDEPVVDATKAYAAMTNSVEDKIIASPIVPPAVPPIDTTRMDAEPDDKSERNIVEKLLGGNLLAKIGIVTLVLGIGFFVKYAIDQGWINEIGRVAIGLLTGGIIIGIAHKLKEKYSVFSSILVGGGISVFYVTITLAFREYEIFSQTVAFVLLIAVTIFSVILSLFYNRQELAIFSLIGGVLAPLMISTGEGNYVVLFSYMLILNTGMLIVSLKKSWNLIGIFAYVSSLLFYWSWLGFKFKDQYLGATVFASLFFVQFYILAIIKHFREGKRMTMFQAVLILTNNLSMLLASMYILNDCSFDLKGLAVMAIAIVNAMVMIGLFRQSQVDKNMIYLIIAVVMSFVTLAVPIQLRGHVITMFWAAESVLLLWLWQRSKINVFRIGFLLISIFALISYLMDINNNYNATWNLSLFVNRIFITGVVLVLSYGVNLFLLRKEDKTDEIRIGKNARLFTVGNLITLFRFTFTILLFFVPFLEFNYQLAAYTEAESYFTSFRYLTLATYTYLFIGGLAILARDKITNTKYYLFLVAFGFYALIYSYLVTDLRFDVYYMQGYKTSYFLMHLLSLPAIAYLVYILVKNVRSRSESAFKVLCWTLVILSVIVLSVELDNMVIMLLGVADNYYSLLYDIRTFGYPILWGLIAGGLMAWGLKGKEVLLRKISLISFAVIIVKFYAYDVWYMSQAGRVGSFVALGVILLSVSFMQQKIKTLVKEDEEVKNENTEE